MMPTRSPPIASQTHTSPRSKQIDAGLVLERTWEPFGFALRRIDALNVGPRGHRLQRKRASYELLARMEHLKTVRILAPVPETLESQEPPSRLIP